MANLARLQGYDKDAAAKIAASTIKELYEQYPDAKEVQVSFVLEDEADYMRFKKGCFPMKSMVELCHAFLKPRPA